MRLVRGLSAVAFAWVMGAACFAQASETMVQTVVPAGSATAPYPVANRTNIAEIRIVRLSVVTGQVQMDHGAGAGFEQALVNLPVTQSTKLRTQDGLAEVELEDDSTVRLAPNTEIEFVTLGRDAAGTVSAVRVLRGTVYASLEKTRGVSLTLTSDAGSVAMQPGSRVRLIAGPMRTEFAVIKGKDAFTRSDGDARPVEVKKDRELTLLAGMPSATSSRVDEILDAPYDSWNEQQEDYHEANTQGSGYGSPFLYGGSDLNYYGSFANVAGCGNVWRPYFAGAGWDPYGAGLWAFYPGAGYSYVSAYPWGWTPFHSGAWMDCGSGLWGWAPVGGWNGLGDGGGGGVGRGGTGRYGNVPITKRHPLPIAPAGVPVAGKGTLLFAGQRPTAISGLNARTQSFEFRGNSAGLGVPRDMFGGLKKVSAGTQRTGMTTVPMVTERVGMAGGAPVSTWRPANSAGGIVRPANEPSRAYTPPTNGGSAPTRSYSPPPSFAPAPHSSAPPASAGAGASHPSAPAASGGHPH